jgi:hypothetical protein
MMAQAKPFVPGGSSTESLPPSEIETNSQTNLSIPQLQPTQVKLPSPRSKQVAYYDVYDPYQTEEDQGVKYTCRYDIQIDNEKEF